MNRSPSPSSSLEVTPQSSHLAVKILSSTLSPFLRLGTIVNAHGTQENTDVLCEGGIITQIGQGLKAPAGARVIDAKGKFLMPGGIDPHTHMQLPFMGEVACDNFESGTKASVAGGTTTIIDFVIPSRKQGLLEGYAQWMKWAEPSVCDYAFHVAVSHWDDKTSPSEMKTLVNEHGITSFKHFTAYKGALMLEDDEIIKSYTVARDCGAIVTNHCENGEMVTAGQRMMKQMGVTGPEGHPQSRPPAIEEEATNRVARIAQQVNVPCYIVHCSCKEAMEAIARAKLKGQKIFGEALAGHLNISDEHYYHKDWDYAAAHVMSPPFRAPENQVALWNGLKVPTEWNFLLPTLILVTKFSFCRITQTGILDTTATDHCPFDKRQKRMGFGDFTKIPNGCTGVEERLPVLWTTGVNTGRITKTKFVEVTSTKTAKIFGLYPRKGVIQVGSDADIVVWNPEAKHTFSAKTHHSRIDMSVFEGFECVGMPEVCTVRGNVLYEDKKVTVKTGYGQYIKRKPFAPFVYDGLEHTNKTHPTLNPKKIDRV